MQTVLLKRGRQTGTSCGGHSRLAAIKALSEQLVCVRPVEVSNLILDVLALALIMGATDDFPKNRVLHHDARKSSDVGSCRFVIFMGKTVRIGIVGRLEAQSTSIPVHFLQEVLHWLIALQSPLILVERATSTRIDTSSWILLLIALLVLRVIRALFIVFESSCRLKQILAKVLGQGHSGIITRGQHQSVKQIPDGKHITTSELG